MRIMLDGQYSRLVLERGISLAEEKPKLIDHAYGLAIEGVNREAWTIDNYMLKRYMSDGALQPVTGTAVNKGGSATRVRRKDGADFFSLTNRGTVALQWYMTDRAQPGIEHYVQGQGGISRYAIQVEYYPWANMMEAMGYEKTDGHGWTLPEKGVLSAKGIH